MWNLIHTLQPSSYCKSLQCKRLLCSPIACLPPEILSYIFRLYLLPLNEQIHTSSLGVQSPSSLAQVCRIWKAIIESDPYLWASICFYFPKDVQKRLKEDERRIPHIVDLHVKFSGTLPLSFAFTHLCDRTESTTTVIDLLENRLREHSRRWKRISLHMGSDYITILLGSMQYDLSSLEHVYIHNDFRLCSRPTPYLNLKSATNLKSFTSNEFFYGISTGDLHWRRLVEASFDFAPKDICLLSQKCSLLMDCRNVVTCSLGLHESHDRMWHTIVPSIITFPRLQTLRVRRLVRKTNTSIVRRLNLPRLKTLEIDSRRIVGSYKSWEHGVFSDLLDHSGCTLHHLSIRDVDFSNDELVRCLKLSPTLTSLCFIPYWRSHDIEDVIRKLDVSYAATELGDWQAHGQTDAGTDPLVPKLREITLATSKERHLDSMMEMLRSRGGAHARAAGVAALRRVEVVLFRKPWIQVMCRPRGWLKKLERFRENLEQWASAVEIEQEGRGGVVTKVGIRRAAEAKGKDQNGTG